MILRVVEDRETVDMDERGNLVRFRRIEFMLDNYGPYVYQVKVEDWSLQKFKDYVKKLAEEISQIEGTEF